MSRSRKRSLRWRLVALAAAAVTLSLALTANAGATLYTAKISPTAADAGSTATYTLTIRNLLGPRMGSVNAKIPAGWTDASVVGTPTVLKPAGAVSDRVWTAELDGSTVKLRADGAGPANKLPLLWSVRVSLEVTAPCTPGASAWETAARTGSDFSGIWFARLGPKPKVTVSGACAHHLDFDQQPTDTVLGDAIAPAVTVLVENAAGDQVDYDGPVMLTLTGPGSFTGGSTTTVNAVDGLATFDDLEIDDVGTYTLEATSGSLLPDTSDEFEVVYAQTVIETSPNTETSGTNCSEGDDATDGVPSCVTVQLPNGANGPVSLVTNGPLPGAPEGATDFNSVLGDFKDGEGVPLYSEEDPGTIVFEYDVAGLPSCDFGGYDRALLGYYEGDYYPDRDPDLLLNEPRTCLELFVQFSEGGTWHPVPVCAEYHDYPEPFDEQPDGDEEFWYDEELGFGSLFDDDGDEELDSGACMAASEFDEDGDLLLYVLFFGDPRFAKR